MDILESEGLFGIRGCKGTGNGFRVEVRHQLPGIEQGLTVVALVHDAAESVLRGRMDQAQAQHVPALSGVAPQGVPATWTHAMAVAGFDVLAIRAGGAQPPLLDGRHTGIDAPDHDAPPARVELVLWGELAQRGGGRSEIVIDDGVAFFRLRLALFRLAAHEDDGLESHPLLRECVVGQQSFVGQESEGLALVDRLQKPLKRSPLIGETLDAYLGLLVGRTLLERPDATSQGVSVVAQGTGGPSPPPPGV